jgi:hypothetical protein
VLSLELFSDVKEDSLAVILGFVYNFSVHLGCNAITDVE